MSDTRGFRSPGQLFSISALWLALNFWWAGVLGILLQTFVEGTVGNEWKGTYFAIISAVGAALSSIVQLVVGPLSDRTRSRYGRRVPFIFLGVMLTLPAIWLFFYASLTAKSFLLLLVAFGWIQIWLNVANGPYQALIPDLVPENRQGVASGFMGAMNLVGQAGAFFAIAIFQHDIWMMCWLAIGLLALGVIQTSYSCREVHEPEPGLGRFHFTQVVHVPFGKYPDFTWLMVSRFFINLGFYTAVAFLLYYLQNTLHSANPQSDMVKLVLIVSFTGALGCWPAGRLADRISKKGLVYITSAILAVCATLFVFNQSLIAAMVIGAGFGVAWGGFMAVDWALASNLVPKAEEGKWMAIWHLAFTVPQVFAAWPGPIADLMNKHYGMGVGWRLPFALIPIYMAIGAWAIRHVRERIPEEAE